MDIKRQVSFCTDCMSPSTRGFKKVITLKNSGLLFFQHIGEERTNLNILKETKKNSADKSKRLEIFILHNDSDYDLRRPDYATEMCQLRTRCCRCLHMVKRVRSLLDELNVIRKNEVIGVCEHCKRNPGSCRRCQYIVNKYLDGKTALRKEKQEQFRSWLSKLIQFLNNALNDENLDKGKITSDRSALELERLLQELREPLQLRNLHTNLFPADSAQLSSMTTGYEMIDELITKIKPEDLSKMAPFSQDLSKLPPFSPLAGAKGEKGGEDLPLIGKGMPKQNQKEVTEPSRKIEIKKGKSKVTSETICKGSTSKPESNANSSMKQSAKTPSNVKESHGIKENKKEEHKSIPEIMGLIFSSKRNEKNNETKNQSRDIQKDIPHRKKETKEDKNKPISEMLSEDSSDSYVESGHQSPDLITEMIKKTKIVKYNPKYKDDLILIKSEKNFLPDLFVDPVEKKQHRRRKEPPADGVLRYKLSDKTFISNGYTILPVIKVMKRDYLYKMEPVKPQFNWFERHKDLRTMNYDTGKILAVINEDGTGRWFYKNGRIALDYYDSEGNQHLRQRKTDEEKGSFCPAVNYIDEETGRRYVFYSSGEESNQDPGSRLKELKNRPQRVLGVFDVIGNGVVYDLHGNERIKYNQTDGIIIDSKIGPVGRWKWHSLNDPHKLEPILADNYDHSLCISKLKGIQTHDKISQDKRQQNPEVLQAELQIFAKERAHKLQKKFTPYQIRMKAFKVNDELSLRIIDQANINMLYRHGTVSMKLNLGLHLVSNEIVQTQASEVGDIMTPYDRVPPRTSSLANIQANLKNAKNLQSRDTARKTPDTYLPLWNHNVSTASSI